MDQEIWDRIVGEILRCLLDGAKMCKLQQDVVIRKATNLQGLSQQEVERYLSASYGSNVGARHRLDDNRAQDGKVRCWVDVDGQ